MQNEEKTGILMPESKKNIKSLLPDEIKNDGISYLDDEFLNTQTTVFKNLSDDANKLMQDLWIEVKSAG